MFIKTNTIAIGSDHGGYELKEHLLPFLSAKGLEIFDIGAHSADSVDYPEYGKKVAELVASGAVEAGIIICGTGIGISIAANRVAGVRAALCHNAHFAALSRQHNDANVLALSGRFTRPTEAEQIVQTWLSTEFEGGRHQTRIDKIDQ